MVTRVESFDSVQKKTQSDLRYASLEGEVTTLGHGGFGTDFNLSRDRKFVVFPGDYRPLIWDLSTDRPRATPFLYLTPSSTSGRWIGIEKDTRQLVIVDENFNVSKRFDEVRPPTSYGFQLNWSPDEQFILWRNQVGYDHFSNWEGFRMDLRTAEKQTLSGRAINEFFAFTGHKGEYLRYGAIFRADDGLRCDRRNALHDRSR